MALRSRQKLGKYRVERRLAEGGFATVYQALDTIEGIRVALKVPHQRLVNEQTMADFQREVRLTAPLDHPHVLPLKNAAYIDGLFVIAYPLGDETLEDRMQRRMSPRSVLNYVGQILSALAYAHARKIIHCDVKPDNLILFPGNHLRLTDFGIAKVAQQTVPASGSGTVGYMAPEQAMGRPAFGSDVFSAGLIMHQMLTGHLPVWPYAWPTQQHDKLRRRLSPSLIAVIRRAMAPELSQRFRDAGQMLSAFERAQAPAASGLRLVRPTIRRKQTARRVAIKRCA